MSPRVYVVVSTVTGAVRGFAYVTQKWAAEGAKEADQVWVEESPHKVLSYVPEETRK